MSNAPVFSLTFPLPAFWNISRVFYPINYTWICLAVTYILLIYCLLHTTYIHYLYVAQFPSDCKGKKEENKMSKKVSACKGGGNFRTFQDFYSRLKEVSIWKCYWSIVRWILRNKAAFKQEAQENNHFSTSWWKLLYVFPIDVTRNEHLKQETRKKCQPRKERKIGGRSATVPHHTHHTHLL